MMGILSVAVLLGTLIVRCASSATHDPEIAVRTYLESQTLDAEVAALAPEYRLWFGERSGEGLDRARVAKMLEWDYALHPRHRIDSVDIRGPEVIVRVHEDNDFSLLIGFPGWDATSTYVVDANGRIAWQLYIPSGDSAWRPYLDRPLEWIREHHPEALPRIFPNGKLSQTSETARE
jgi:hypothetical protein